MGSVPGRNQEKLQDVLKYLLIDHLKLGIKEILKENLHHDDKDIFEG